MTIVTKMRMKEKKGLMMTKTVVMTSQNPWLLYSHWVKSIFRDDVSGSNCLFI